MSNSYVGVSVKRKEDPALLTGKGKFVDDIHLNGMLHAVMVRSTYAHAVIKSIEATAALELDGVVAVITAADLPEEMRGACVPLLVPNAVIRHPRTPPILATDEVRYVGEAIAVVVAEDRYVAEDAAERVLVDYEPLPVVADVRQAIRPDAPVAHRDLEDDIACPMTQRYGDVEAAFASAAHVVEYACYQHRGSAHAMECRALIAEYDELNETMTLWSNTQTPHQYRGVFADMMDVPEQQVRVFAHDVGGGFGPKAVMYPEQFSVPACAMLTGRPIKWVEDRREHFVCATQERDQYWDGQMALDDEANILGYRVNLLHDNGAYLPWGVVAPYIASVTVPGPYVVPAYEINTRVVFTNRVSISPVRGAGRPQAATFTERMMDRAAEVLGMDRAVIRRRNYVRPEQMPYSVGLVFRDGRPIVYDSGDYPQVHDKALELSEYHEFAARQAAARAEGRYIGIGIGSYVEATGLGPYEAVSVHVMRSGKVIVHTGAAPQGQGHETMMAQVAAEALGVRYEDVRVKAADTQTIQRGVGTFASRIAPIAAPSAHIAALNVRKKALKIGAHLLEAAEADLDIQDGKVFVKGIPEHGMTLREIAIFANGMPGFALPEGLEPVLEDTQYFAPTQAAYANGTHVVEVEVDTDTGLVKILRYSASHDCGTIINPISVDAQVMGGVAHGVGNALFERMHYDDNGQPTTTNFGEYLLPTAPEVPSVAKVHIESPSPLNPLGVKGAGEGGTIPAIGAIASAVEHALVPFNVRLDEMPIEPEKLLDRIDAGR